MQRCIATETPSFRQTRLDRERNSQRPECPGKRGAMVFQWIDLNDDGNFIRSAVTRKQVDDIWPTFSRYQRRFNSLDNEWDLCEEFGEYGPESEDEDFILDGPDDDIYGIALPTNMQPTDPNTVSAPIAPTTVSMPPDPTTVSAPMDPASPTTQHCQDILPPMSNDHWQQELEATYGGHQTPGLHPLPEMPLEDHLFHRYGFSTSIGYASDKTRGSGTLADAALIFGHREGFVRETGKKIAIVEFFKSLLESSTVIHRELCDLHPGHDSYLLGLLPSSHAKVDTKHVEGQVYYLVEPNNPSAHQVQWRVVTQDPCTAVQCLREDWASSRVNLAKALLRRGIPFSTRAPLPMLIPKKPPYLVENLGIRHEDYSPGKFDYCQYERKLKELVKEPRVARAALLMGGMVWRLVMEVLGSSSAEALVIGGPSDSAYYFGNGLKLEPSGATPWDDRLWDDALTNEELNLICGLYHIYTGQFHGEIICIFHSCQNT